MAAEEEEEELLDYEEEDVAKTTTPTASKDGEKKGEKNKKKGYVGMHSTGFRDFLLKPDTFTTLDVLCNENDRSRAPLDKHQF